MWSTSQSRPVERTSCRIRKSNICTKMSAFSCVRTMHQLDIMDLKVHNSTHPLDETSVPRGTVTMLKPGAQKTKLQIEQYVDCAGNSCMTRPRSEMLWSSIGIGVLVAVYWDVVICMMKYMGVMPRCLTRRRSDDNTIPGTWFMSASRSATTPRLCPRV